MFFALSSVEWRVSQNEAILGRWGLIVVGFTGVMVLYGYVALSASASSGLASGAVNLSSAAQLGYPVTGPITVTLLRRPGQLRRGGYSYTAGGAAGFNDDDNSSWLTMCWEAMALPRPRAW